jgi:hypothetical protein
MTCLHVILRTAVVLSLLSPLALASTLRADPLSISSLAGKSSLSQSERDQVREYGSFWTDALADAEGQVDEVRRIRGKLLEPVRRGGVTDVFRDQYSRAVRDPLEKIIDDGNGYLAVTSIIVLSQMGTDRCLDTLLERCTKSDEPRWQIRLKAAQGCGQLFLLADEEALNAKDYTGAARVLLAAVQEESNALALRRQVEALLTAALEAPAGAKPQIRSAVIQALIKTAERAAGSDDDPVGLLDAVYPTINKLREAYIQLGPSEQREFGRKLGPCLRGLLDVAETHWADLQRETSAAERLGKIIFLCERFLSTIDTFVRNGADPPATKLKQAWDEGDQDRYRSDLKRWRDVLSQPPY